MASSTQWVPKPPAVTAFEWQPNDTNGVPVMSPAAVAQYAQGETKHSVCDKNWTQHGIYNSGGEVRPVCPGDYIIPDSGELWGRAQFLAQWAPA